MSRRVLLAAIGGFAVACSAAEPADVPRCGRGFAQACDVQQAENYVRLAAQAVNVHRAWRLGNSEWSETLVDFSDRAYNEVRRKACGTAWGERLTDSCAYRVSLVVERRGEERTGRVLYASSADLDGPREPTCVEYSDCVVAGYVEKIIRLPQEVTGWVSLDFFVQAVLPAAIERDLELPALRLDLEITQEQLDRFHRKDWQSDPRLRFLVPHYQSEVRYYRRKIAEME